MSKFAGGAIVWGIWILAYFLPLELTAHFWAACPWPTLSRETWDLESHWETLRLFIVAFCLVLGLHLALRLSVAALLFVITVAASTFVVHLLAAKHPVAGVTVRQLLGR